MGQVVSIFAATKLQLEKRFIGHYDGLVFPARAGESAGQYRLTESEKAALRRAFRISDKE